MIDCSRVEAKLKQLLGCEDEEASYENYILNAVSAVIPLIKDEQYHSDSRIIYLCAVKALYQLKLADQLDDDGVLSFTAGDVSYKRGTSPVEAAKALVDNAIEECGELINDRGFAFRVV